MELSAAFPPEVVVCALSMIARWKHRKQPGERWGCDQCICVQLWARWSLNICPPHFNPSPSVLSSLLPLLMYLNAVSSSAASEQSINTGNATHLWNITPSLTVSAHHWQPHPHTADREEDNTGQLEPWPSITACNHRQGVQDWNCRCLKQALIYQIVAGNKCHSRNMKYPTKRFLNEAQYHNFSPCVTSHLHTIVINVW